MSGMPSYVVLLRAVNVGGRFLRVGAGFEVPCSERTTGRTTTWRDLKVVRAIDEKWGA
jgi:hypothetical protein